MTERVGVDFLERWIDRFAAFIWINADLLTTLDSAIGDADHGINMNRGMAAAVAVLREAPPDSPAKLLYQVGATLASTVGGASGPLYGTFFLRMGAVAGSYPDGLDALAFATALRSGIDGVVRRGSAERGDKTMFDVLDPAAEALEDALATGASLADAMRRAGEVAARARDATRAMCARKGRASYLGERSIGHQDPGATSAAMLIAALTTPGDVIAHRPIRLGQTWDATP